MKDEFCKNCDWDVSSSGNKCAFIDTPICPYPQKEKDCTAPAFPSSISFPAREIDAYISRDKFETCNSPHIRLHFTLPECKTNESHTLCTFASPSGGILLGHELFPDIKAGECIKVKISITSDIATTAHDAPESFVVTEEDFEEYKKFCNCRS